jgi:hypothetical protein
MAEIFVSYRRGDSAGHTGRLVDGLERRFGRAAVFQDVQSIEAGRRWDQVIADGVGNCRALVAVIGREWLAAGADGRRRIDDPQDHLRREVATALERGIPVIPALVEGARMPGAAELPDDLKALARWQAHELSDSRWDYDIGRLMDALARAAGLGPPAAAPAEGKKRRSPTIAAVVIGLVGALAVVAWLWRPAEPARPTESAAAAPGPAPAPSPSVPIAPVRFDGSWHDEDATHWTIRQKNDKVEISHTAPGSGTAIGYAEGTASGRTISFEYIVLVPDEPRLSGQLVLSDDGKRLTGVLTNMKEGGNTRIVLHRREP